MTGSLDRRTVLRTTAAGLAATAVTGCVGSLGGSSRAEASADFDGWFSNVSNYDGVVDRTEPERVEVVVGAKGNDGNMAFAPAAVRVSTGITVVWTSNGGMHNVVARDGSFESEMMTDAGETYEHTFESAGKYEYLCSPHEQMGMKGAVVVE
jgi:halocyanin-like protein